MEQKKKLTIISTLIRGYVGENCSEQVVDALKGMEAAKILYADNSKAQRQQLKNHVEKLDEFLKIPRSLNTTDIRSQITFTVDKRIALVALGFLGPYMEEKTRYDVFIEIIELPYLAPSRTQDQTVLFKLERRMEARKREIFLIELDEAVSLPPNKYIRIEYMMKGPPAALCDKSTVKNVYICEDGITFSFSQSSRQIPIIQYTVL